MDEELFIQNVNIIAREYGLNPLLLLSGIEGLYTFRNVQLNSINYEFLDSLILTIYALRIGDQFHSIAEENLASSSVAIRQNASMELKELQTEDINESCNPYLQSFATIIDGKSPIRKYHEKALEVAAVEIRKAQMNFSNNSIGTIMLYICKTDEDNKLGL
ncbi:MAG TPA: hypothetical protein VFQ58_05960, partial [Flavisolibacter sp.]|nr:hypothetical protein [Flavisolibacter sp.]